MDKSSLDLLAFEVHDRELCIARTHFLSFDFLNFLRPSFSARILNIKENAARDPKEGPTWIIDR